MKKLIYISLETPEGSRLILEHRKINYIYDFGDGTYEVAGWIVTNTPEEIINKIAEVREWV